MTKRRIRNESFENMSRIVPESEPLDVHTGLDPVTAEACMQHADVAEHLEEISEELEKKTEGLVPESEEVNNPVENTYTAALKLDESFTNFMLNEDYFDTDEYRVTRYQDDIAECIEYIQDKLEGLENKYNEGKLTANVYADKLSKIYDILSHDSLHRLWTEEFKLPECGNKGTESKFFLDECSLNEEDGRSHRVVEEDDKDKHLDLDMADFLMCLVADGDDLNPKSPLGRPFKKFKNTVYNDEDGLIEYPSQVGGSDTEITVYSDSPERFDDMIAICNIWKLRYKGPTASRNSSSYWKYYLDIEIPLDEHGLPMLIEDYFVKVFPEEKDTVMYKVMPTAFARAYYKKKAKMDKDNNAALNAIAVRKAVKAAITAASLDGSRPLTDFLDDMYAQLAGLKYSKRKVTKEFMDAFADDNLEDDE